LTDQLVASETFPLAVERRQSNREKKKGP